MTKREKIRIGNVKSVMAYAELQCDHCGRKYERITRVPIIGSGHVAWTVTITGSCTCPDCLHAGDAKRERLAIKKYQQKQWASGKPAALAGQKGFRLAWARINKPASPTVSPAPTDPSAV